MAVLAIDRSAAAERRAYLKEVVGDGGRVRLSTSLLLLDSVAAIGFAAGLAGAASALVAGSAIWGWVTLTGLSGLARGLCVWGSARVGARGARAAKSQLRERIVTAALHRAPGAMRTSGELLQAAVDEVEAIDGHVARFLPARQAAGLSPMIVMAAVAVASPVSAAILFATLVPFILALILAGGAAADQSRRQFAALARLSGLFADRLRALPVVLAFEASEREAERLGIAAQDVASRTMRVLRVAFLSSGALEFFSALSVALVAVYCGFNLLGLLPFPVPETLDLASAFFVLALAPEFYAPLRRLAAAYHDKQAAETAVDRLSAVEREATSASALPVAGEAPGLSFESVSIRYDDTDAAAVANVTFAVRPGEIVALWGPSGSGKTSLLRVLLGLAPLAAGAVRINGELLPPGGSIAAGASWLGQGTLLLPKTIAQNIGFADPHASRARIEEAARQAGLTPMIEGRPNGLDTLLDARSSGLSGGERRRIGLARAILKPAPLLLLDEPTAHLDAAAEHAMIETIASVAKGRTILMATHSEALAAIADRIIPLERLA
ncbi:thiol reductant ABC exporter subunit CydD [Sphingomonas sp. IC4-52]|uniref:thiol reductant ABC exporter subunit CydD n=1 Tax=Sphingomonas sp. IC4-52 TaxID=2887202 RepID=UPI001D11FCBD|nr:thiol reductant ABC exporter subunit CydD [Sphingomonas sp. IC4-52]MCC2979505.1 thiol reductant ABC exporter subunit CydD [Sphingomonas sp. IC4-52]